MVAVPQRVRAEGDGKRLEAAGTDRAQPSPLADAIQRILPPSVTRACSQLSAPRAPHAAHPHISNAPPRPPILLTNSRHAYTHLKFDVSPLDPSSYDTMTRTERAAHPHALIKDRSVSKNGMDARLPKGGAGGHNWGDLSREQYLEEAATYDEQEDFIEEGRE